MSAQKTFSKFQRDLPNRRRNEYEKTIRNFSSVQLPVIRRLIIKQRFGATRAGGQSWRPWVFARNAELNEQRQAASLKRFHKDQALIDRNYVHQPPLIPHDIRGYKVDLNSNKCLSCHGWKYAGEVGATKISPTHFETADGITLSDVAPRRYFCLQCHVPQADAKPLIANEFVPVDALKSSK